MTSTIKILDRIKKLLAMAQGKGGSANEVAVAAAEAARLMQLHKLTEQDIPTDDVHGPDMVDLPAGADFLDSWRFVLVTCAARSFMCDTIGLRSAGRRKVRVVGRREDVEVALEVYRHLAEEIERLTGEYEGDSLDADRGWGDLWDTIFGAAFGSMGSTDRARAAIDRDRYVDEDLPYFSSRVEARARLAIDPLRREAYRDGLVAGVATRLREQKVSFEASGEKAMVVARKSKEEIRSYMTTKFTDPNRRELPNEVSSSMDEVDFARGFTRGQQMTVAPAPRTVDGTSGKDDEKTS